MIRVTGELFFGDLGEMPIRLRTGTFTRNRSGEGLFQMLKFASAFVYRAETHFATQKNVKRNFGNYIDGCYRLLIRALQFGRFNIRRFALQRIFQILLNSLADK